MNMTIESTSLARISAYMAKNRIKSALEDEISQDLDFEANVESSKNIGGGPMGQTTPPESRRLDCIYNNEPLEFEKDPLETNKKMQAKYPLEEISLGKEAVKRPTYINAKIDLNMKRQLVEPHKEYKDCFAWDYDEMSGLIRNTVELKLPIRHGKKPVKKLPRRFAPEIMLKIKEEIKRMLKRKFIRTAKYVEWLVNIVPIIKKNCTLRVCIDFRDLNNATPKDEYPHACGRNVDRFSCRS